MADRPQILQFPAERKIPARLDWHRWLIAATAIYWLGMFIATHVPHPPRLTESDGVDKWMHFGAYLGLAILLSTVLVARRSASRLLVIQIVALLASVGAFDEITQPLVGRDCEFLDWCADVTGALIGSSLIAGIALACRRRSLAQRRRAA